LFKRVTLFRFFGFPVKGDASWLFLGILIVWSLSNKFYPVVHAVEGVPPGDQLYQMMAMATLAGILVSIIAHEVAHAVIAEYYHMPIESITLFIFGGVAEMKGEPSHPKGEFLMAIAGPIMSVLMGLFFWAAEQLYIMHVGEGPVSQVLKYLGNINMLIAAFNMAPAFPLDGGRALRAALWHYKKNMVEATRIASQLGAIFAYGLLGYAIYRITWYDDMVTGLWSGLLGYFVWGAGAYAVRQTESRSLLGQETVSRFMKSDIVSISPDMTIADFVDNYVYKHYQKIYPVVDKGQLSGLITLQSVLALDRAKWAWLHVASVMEPLTPDNTVQPSHNAADALALMQKKGKDSLLIAENGEFRGVIALRDLFAYLSISMKMSPDRPLEASREDQPPSSS